MARAFRSVGRASDALGRTGPTEFAVFAPASNTWAAARLVRRLADSAERNSPVGVRSGYSAAVAAQKISPHVLLSRARNAMESAAT